MGNKTKCKGSLQSKAQKNQRKLSLRKALEARHNKRRMANQVPQEEWNFCNNEQDLPELLIEVGPPHPSTDPKVATLEGRRIVDIKHFLTQVRDLERHRCPVHPGGSMRLQKEKRYGLMSVFDYKCGYCNHTCSITTDPVERLPSGRKPRLQETTKLGVTDAAVWGSVSTGHGHGPLEEFLSILGVPPMSAKTYRKHEDSLGQKWEEILSQSMKKAAEEEKELAMAANRLNDGVPWTTGIVDGGWSQRSHGHRYSAKSGCAAIVGFYTKKLLYVGVRNKFCIVCAKAANREEDAGPHKCFKNWNGSSTAMEADILVEGFQFCEQEYGLRIMEFVGDGDSNVHSALLNSVSYGNRIKKIECANHVIKNFTKVLYVMAKGSNGKHLSASRIKHLSRCARLTISRNTGNKEGLVADLRNVPDHVFGDHSRCKPEFCKNAGKKFAPLLLTQLPPGLLVGIRQAIARVLGKVDSLARNCTSNLAESYMSRVAKFIGGKQVNRSQQGSYTRRCHAAALSFQHGGKWHERTWKAITTKSPNQVVKRLCDKTFQRQAKCRQRLFQNPGRTTFRPKTKEAPKPDGDKYYGPEATQPDVSSEELQLLGEEFVSNKVQVTADQRKEIEEATRDQSGGSESAHGLWREERKVRLTASNFGAVSKMRDSTPCRATVSRLLYPEPVQCSPAIRFGIANEPVAIAQYEAQTNSSVIKCGLIIDEELPFLAATPDGLVSTEGVLEVKCPFSARNMTPVEAARCLKQFCSVVDSGNQLHLKVSHNYYYQIQGQLHITRRQWCDFVIWTPKGTSIERIVRDDTFWNSVMYPKLHRFYHCCLLPELASPRYNIGGIREPRFVKEAQEALESRKGRKRKADSME